VNDFRDVHFNELIERLDLMANDLFSIGLSNEGLENMAIVGELIHHRRYRGRCHGLNRVCFFVRPARSSIF
jgi:hypothetical protein